MLCTGNGQEAWHITFNPPEITAVPGLCALISCTFTYPEEAKPIDNVQWIVCRNGQCKKDRRIFKGKVSTQNKIKLEEKETETERIKMLEPDLTKNNCSIIMKDITAEDENEYAFRVEGQNPHKITYKATVKIIIQDEPIMDIPPLSEGVEASLTCSAPFPCPETPPEITWWIKTRRGNITNLKDVNITLITSRSLYLSTLHLTPTSKLHNATVGCDVIYGNKTISASKTLEVTYVETLRILGDDKVMEGDTLRLNCTVESHPPSSDPVWSFNGTADKIRNHTSAENLMITNVRKEHAGIYVCEMIYMNETLNASITINVIRENLLGKDDLLNSSKKCKEAFQMQVDIRMIIGFLIGISVSAVIFSVVLCCHESWQSRDETQVVATNTDTEVILEVFYDQQGHPKK
ncbi:hypothetical protein R3I94_006737 [Phoxinus phoxinus]